MNKLLFYINVIGGGGAERVMANLSMKFALSGYDVIFVTTYRIKNEYTLLPGITRYNLEDINKKGNIAVRNIRRILELRKIIKCEKPNAVITFMFEPNFRGLVATLGIDVKNIISVRDLPTKEYDTWFRRIVARLLLPQTDGCVFQTEDQKRWFPKKLQYKSSVIPNEVNPIFFESNRHPCINRIVTLGRLTEQKNHKMLIEAFSKVTKKIDDATLYIYGCGELKDKLERIINKLGLQEKVFLAGYTKEVTSCLGMADLFVLSSNYEGMPNTLMEAMAMGTPCISTNCDGGGAKALIRNGIDGVLVPKNDVKSMSNAIIKVLGTPYYKELLGKRARKRSRNFDPDKIFYKWERYVNEVIKE